MCCDLHIVRRSLLGVSSYLSPCYSRAFLVSISVPCNPVLLPFNLWLFLLVSTYSLTLGRRRLQLYTITSGFFMLILVTKLCSSDFNNNYVGPLRHLPDPIVVSLLLLFLHTLYFHSIHTLFQLLPS